MNLDVSAVEYWIAHDPSEKCKAELSELLACARSDADSAKAAQIELADRFSQDLTFGTAGLRGEMAAGPNRMNLAVVIRATAGLSQVLAAEAGADFKVVIGFDGRYHSDEFAQAAAQVITAAGGKALLMPHIVPTPVTAFAVNQLGADAGIMVTASHNPAPDNGYKVYLGGRIVTGAGQGAQLVAPYDAKIFAAITSMPPADQVPLAQSGWEIVEENLIAEYIAKTSAIVPDQAPRQLRLVLTSMHGVGAMVCESALSEAGFHDVHPVMSQREPDPDFPTVPFPNPEEAGALDAAMELAREVNADLIVANDPDADRCCAAIPDKSVTGGWRQLSGDEAGAILGDYAGKLYAGKEGATMCRSVVSGSLLDKVAASYDIAPKISLTGFKWIARTPGMVFGYEEAIGNCCVPQVVRDKDGISATVRFAQIAAELKAQGKDVAWLLDQLAVRHGLHVTAPLTFRVADLTLIAAGMRRLRENGLEQLGGDQVCTALDLSENAQVSGEETSVGASWENLTALPPTDALFFGTDSGSRVIVRPSGTEPKLKCYLEVVDDLGGNDLSEQERLGNLEKARQNAQMRLETMKADLKAALGF